MREIKRLITVAGIVAFFIIFYFLCINFAKGTRGITPEAMGIETKGLTTVESASFELMLKGYIEANYSSDINISAVGDLMVYDYQLEYALKDGGFDFSNSFSYITPFLSDNNMLIGDLEGVMAGPDSSATEKFNGYTGDKDSMTFNIPETFADALKKAGFTILSLANEQALDMGRSGLKNTIDNLDKKGMIHTGTVSETGDKRYITRNINGINFAILSYTNVMDENRSEEDLEYVNYLKGYDATAVNDLCQLISKTKTEGIDCVIVYLHDGTLYSGDPTEEQRSLARKLCDSGADIIFSSHPHVIQPMELYKTGNEGERNCLIFYSLGNFLSSQQYQLQNKYPRDLGCIVKLHMEKDKYGVKIDTVKVLPTYVDWTDDVIRVVPVTDVKDNPSKYEGEFDYLDYNRIDPAYEGVVEKITEGTGLSYTYKDLWYEITID